MNDIRSSEVLRETKDWIGLGVISGGIGAFVAAFAAALPVPVFRIAGKSYPYRLVWGVLATLIAAMVAVISVVLHQFDQKPDSHDPTYGYDYHMK